MNRYTRFLIAAAAAATSACASAPARIAPSLRTPAALARTYPTIREAAMAALTELGRPARCAEYGGFVLQRGGEYYLSDITMGVEDRVVMRWKLQPSEKVAAIFHTHPQRTCGGGLPGEFSLADVYAQRRLGVPSYIVDQDRGVVLVLDDVHAARCKRVGEQSRTSAPEHCYGGFVGRIY